MRIRPRRVRQSHVPCKIPVRDVPERFRVLGTRVAVVDVVRVFPHVYRQQRLGIRRQRRRRVAGRDDVEAAVRLLHEPGPARTEGADRGLGESFLECGERAPLLSDGRAQGTLGLAAAVGRQAVPVERVVPDLSGVVEYAAARFLHDILERQRFEFRAGDQVVEVRHIGLVMLAVVEIDGFRRDVRLQRVLRVRQFG